MEIDAVQIEDVINKTYPGLTMFVRDSNLPRIVSENYKKGMIIQEMGFCDASNRVMGMVTTHRYGILSNHMANLTEFEHGTNWGLHVAKSGSRFKVLSNFEYHGKTLILLLHLPDDESWKLFTEIELNIDEELVENCIARFKNKFEEEPIPELAKEDWLERCAFPIGMNEDGGLFDVD